MALQAKVLGFRAEDRSEFKVGNDRKESNNKENLDNSGNPLKPLLSRPKTPPLISYNDPGFKNLSTAEKLNDSKYRELIYKTFPKEPTCQCLPKNRSTHPLICRSGCTNKCCMKLRNPKQLLANKNQKKSRIIKTYCVNNIQSLSAANSAAAAAVVSGAGTPSQCQRKICKVNEGIMNPVNRLRGGADVEQLYTRTSAYSWMEYEDMEYPISENFMSTQFRLEGGGDEYGKSSCNCSPGISSTHPGLQSEDKDPHNFSTGDACRPGARSSRGPTPSCVCLGKHTASIKTGDSKCSKKPCLGVDCLIRAFREAQDFVDSIGRVPGLAGLGLMDPSESPFFGRDIDKDYVRESQVDKRKGHSMGMYCEAPCNTTQPGKPISGTDNISTPYTTPASLTIGVPVRAGIVREGIPTFPDANSVITSARQKRREEKQKDFDAILSIPTNEDIGPCGEPKCKSRKRTKKYDDKHMENQASYEISDSGDNPTNTSSKLLHGTHEKLPVIKNSAQSKTVSVKSSSKVSDKGKGIKISKNNLPGPGGDRGIPNKTPIKVSKRVMRYIYTLGDAYPGIHFGHKTCIDPRMRVPANMGWLWNTMAIAGKFKPRIGWRPGAIGRNLLIKLREAKMGSVQQTIRPRSAPSRSKKAKLARSMSLTAVKKISRRDLEDSDGPPTLHIHRKDGTYYVTMYPVQQETPDEPAGGEVMKPLQFKIVKNKDDASDATSSTASDMEIEFSPPAALHKPRPKPDVVHEGTQVHQDAILEATKPSDHSKKKDKKGKKEKEKKGKK